MVDNAGIKHDKHNQLDHVIDDLEHDNDDDNAMRFFLRIQLDRKWMAIINKLLHW